MSGNNHLKINRENQVKTLTFGRSLQKHKLRTEIQLNKEKQLTLKRIELPIDQLSTNFQLIERNQALRGHPVLTLHRLSQLMK